MNRYFQTLITHTIQGEMTELWQPAQDFETLFIDIAYSQLQANEVGKS